VSLNSAQRTAGRIVDCPLWLAPEVLQNRPYTEKADVYSVGVIYWELYTRQKYFGDVSFMSLVEDKVIAGERPPIPAACPPSYRALIQSCWAQDPGILS
jgi:serine/threonine protein kinase